MYPDVWTLTQVQRIAFVGGFSENEYLQSAIAGAFSGAQSLAGYDVDVFKPNQPSWVYCPDPPFIAYSVIVPPWSLVGVY